MKKYYILILTLLISDFVIAQFAKQVFPQWDVVNTERRYRTHNKVYHHDLLPNKDTVGIFGIMRYKVATNSLGFKDKKIRNIDLNSSNYRLLFIGDSFTEGNGIEYKNTFVGRIDKELAQRRIEVLNAAVSTYSPHIYYRKIKFLIEEKKLMFDEVIVFIDLSDPNDEMFFYKFDDDENVISIGAYLGETEFADRDLKISEKLNGILKSNSVFIKFFFTLTQYFFPDDPSCMGCGYCNKKGKDAILTNHGYSMWTIDENTYKYYAPGINIAKHNMDKLLDILTNNNVKLTIAVYPWPDQILYRDINSLQVKIWKEWTKDKKIKFINLFPYFINENDPIKTIQDHYIPCDMHWNENGHKLVAEAFLQNTDY